MIASNHVHFDHIYICKICFLRCKKALKHQSKAREIDDVLSSSLTARMAELNADNLSNLSSEDEADTRPCMPKQPRLESVIPSSRCILPFLQSGTGSLVVTVSV